MRKKIVHEQQDSSIKQQAKNIADLMSGNTRAEIIESPIEQNYLSSEEIWIKKWEKKLVKKSKKVENKNKKPTYQIPYNFYADNEQEFNIMYDVKTYQKERGIGFMESLFEVLREGLLVINDRRKR